MNILIVDGNEKKASDQYLQIGMPTQFQVYENVLRSLITNKCNISTLHPAHKNNYIPLGVNLGDFDGIVWTGSLLNIYDLGPAIERQIELAKELFKQTNKIFGSCWGLHVLATAAGGEVRKNPRGLEAVIANNIIINNDGINHPLYQNKPNNFDSFCWHYDELEKLPNETKVLSSNEMSSIQSIVFKRENSDIWAVQYHPEFNSKWISGLMKQRKSLLLKEGIYRSTDEFNKAHSLFLNVEKYQDKRKQLQISNTVINEDIHTLELANWVKYLMNDI
ncbi:gamma-glutamyl-gamma-aminobutyrate hydrolase family protein [Alphaproteobacteria bacterium]|nr:gamma-glutamyl-gamma-aminobutyrate hydrolase family protein [Alphaproteobacteria bacterium]